MTNYIQILYKILKLCEQIFKTILFVRHSKGNNAG